MGLMEMTTKNAVNKKAYKANWPSKYEEIFIRILHDHVKKGDLQGSTFKGKVWLEIGNDLCAECGKRCTAVQLKSKFNRLRSKHLVLCEELNPLIERCSDMLIVVPSS
ncbi:hypothetical protein GBA52_014759 [Prunus armeniaca]|nr:hypothetical protein GBA52_014759 [Prunus armeniaca]